MSERSYPADPADAALRLFLGWFGAHYARSARVVERENDGAVLRGKIEVGRRWELAFAVLDTLAADADLEYEAARAAVEQRLDAAGRSVALWLPRGAKLPQGEPGTSEMLVAIDEADALPDGRLQVRRPVNLYLRRTGTEGSVVTILGGLSGHWAQFTNRVPGAFQLNSTELFRLPAAQEERDALADRIVLAAQQPLADESQVIAAEDVWTANDLRDGGSCVLGSPKPDTDEQSAALRRNLRTLLRAAQPVQRSTAAVRVLMVLGAATYAEDEKLSWSLRGMDPSSYAGYDIITVITDGVVKGLLEPPRGSLPWDAPPG